MSPERNRRWVGPALTAGTLVVLALIIFLVPEVRHAAREAVGGNTDALKELLDGRSMLPSQQFSGRHQSHLMPTTQYHHGRHGRQQRLPHPPNLHAVERDLTDLAQRAQADAGRTANPAAASVRLTSGIECSP